MLYPAELRARMMPYVRLERPGTLRRKNGAPGTIRTSDPQIRSLMLYPAELRARANFLSNQGHIFPERKVARPERFERPTLRFVV